MVSTGIEHILKQLKSPSPESHQACNDDENLVLDRLAGPQAEEFWSFLRASPDTICTLSAPSIRLERTVATQESPPDATQRPRRKYNRRNSRQTSTVSKYNIMVSKMPEPQQILAGKTPEQISEERSKFNGTYTAPSADSPHLELPGTEEANDCALESSAQLRRMNDLAANASELSSSPDGRLEGFSLPLRLPTCNTVIMTLGRLHKPKDNDWWTNPAKVGGVCTHATQSLQFSEMLSAFFLELVLPSLPNWFSRPKSCVGEAI